MRVAIEAASLALSSGGLARYPRELTLALARCFPDDEFFDLRSAFPHAGGAPPNLKRGGGPRNAMERRWWLWGIASEMAASARTWCTAPISPCPTWRAGPACSRCTISRRGWTNAGTTPPRGYKRRTPVLLELGMATMVITPERNGAQAGDRALPPRSRTRGRGAGSRGAVVPPVPAEPRRSVFPLRRHAGAAQESRALIEAWREVRKRASRSTWCSSAGARGRSRRSPRSRDCASRAKFPIRACRRSIPARWRLSIRPRTKASACRCWRPCNAAPA